MNKAAQQLGKRGGRATVAKHGKEHFRRIARGWPKGKPRNQPETTPNNH